VELMDAIQQRRAVRDYRQEPVSGAVLQQLIMAAIWAPSAMNGQPWHFSAVTDRVLLDKISERSKTWLLANEAPTGEDTALRSMLQDQDSHILHHAPALIVIAAEGGKRWTAEECALVAQNLMLAAAELGLGTCWIGLAQDWLNSPDGRKMVGLKPTDQVVAPIVVGHPRTVPPPPSRRQANIVWIGAEVPPMPEDGGTGEVQPSHGFYGSLIHP
jgi:nitroreductase